MGIKYSPAIDGLRAIAVLAVVLYHAGLGGAGYVGVDVFFVISGYLITRLLLAEREQTGRIDLLAFYARRVRRIFPAAAVVVLATLAASTWLLDYEAQTHTAKSAGAALAFVANVFFQATTGGYWDSAAEEMPLLHLWSLSVEEQFYLLWPALLIFTRSRRSMAALALASLGLSEYWIAWQSDAAFFEMPARFWELAAGGLIASSPARPVPRWMGTCGVLLVLAACAYPLGHFPGVGAVPAVLGACAVIAAVHHGGAEVPLLASRPLVGVGLISYSLYLWHWPLLALYRAKGGDEMPIRIGLCLIAVLLAMLSYRCIEQPFRRMRLPSGRTVVAGATLSVVLASSACALGLREPPPNSAAELAAHATADHMDLHCEYHPGDPMPKCPEPPNARVFVWGDSMALSWSAGTPGAAVYSYPGCLPAVGRRQSRRGCEEWNNAVLERLHGDTLLLAARWDVYGNSLDGMARTFALVRGFRRVVVIGPAPDPLTTPGRCIRGEGPCDTPRIEFDRGARRSLARLREMAAGYPNIEVIDVSDQFCRGDVCPMILDGVVLYHDAAHPSATQARRVMRRMDMLASRPSRRG